MAGGQRAGRSDLEGRTIIGRAPLRRNTVKVSVLALHQACRVPSVRAVRVAAFAAKTVKRQQRPCRRHFEDRSVVAGHCATLRSGAIEIAVRPLDNPLLRKGTIYAVGQTAKVIQRGQRARGRHLEYRACAVWLRSWI